MTEQKEDQIVDRIVWRSELYELIDVCSETVRQWMKQGKLPKPDVQISNKRMGWKLSTLQATGIGLV